MAEDIKKDEDKDLEWSDETETEDEDLSGKKKKNKHALIILLVGLLVGSVFVDVAQLLSRQGFSPRALSNSDIFEYAGRTWVAYDDPVVKVTAVTDDNCETCKPDQGLVFLRRYIPTLEAKSVNIDSEEGKRMMEIIGSKTIPSFIFEPSIESTMFFSQAKQLFEKKDVLYSLNTAQIGLPVGKYTSLPEVLPDDAQTGKSDAKARVIVFTDFQCPYCQLLHPSVMKAITEYGDRIHVVFKHFPLVSIHPQATNASLAAACAQDQGKFFEYSTMLFEKQKDWGAGAGTAKFKQYALQMGLKSAPFNDCLDKKKYSERVDRDMKVASEFGITGTPGMFINDQFINGAVQFDELKKTIDEQLEK